MRCQDDAISLGDSIKGMLVPFIRPDRSCYLIAGLRQESHAGNPRIRQ
jgi:hypothetical protein